MSVRNLDFLVEAKDIGCTYHNGQTQVVALESATCLVKPGDRIALVGPSGSGKSTLLQLLGGLEEPTKGEISWPLLGDRHLLRPKHVGFIFQMPSLLAPLTVVENVEIPLLLMNVPAEKARGEAIEALRRMELEKLANQLPEELSGGQAQRVAVARAVVGKPQLILADEPTGQLDHATADHMLNVLLAALQDTNAALLVATHDGKVADSMNTLWHMSRGRLEWETV
jgi:ABC-type lipoprotein export system ATPase subunit